MKQFRLLITFCMLFSFDSYIFLSNSNAEVKYSYKRGRVAAKGLVLQNGSPYFVEYESDGEISKKIETPQGSENYEIMSADTYRSYIKLFNSLVAKQVDQTETRTIENYKKDYDASQLKPNTKSVLFVLKGEFQIPEVLLEAPIDLCNLKLEVNNSNFKSLLIDNEGKVFYSSKYNIAYNVAVYAPDDGSISKEGRHGLSGYIKGIHQLCAPFEGAIIETGMGGKGATNEEGEYYLGYLLPPCPGFFMSYNHYLYAFVYYTRFNPKDSYIPGMYGIFMPTGDDCLGLGEGFMPTSISGAVHKMTMMDINSSMAISIPRINFVIDIAFLTGNAYVQNQKQPGIGINESLLGTLPQSKTVHLIEQYMEAIYDQGLVSAISSDDLKKTDIYGFRMSNGQLVFSQEGIDNSKQSLYDESECIIDYNISIIGPDTTTGYKLKTFLSWLIKTDMDKDLKKRQADHVKIGEKIKVIMINRPTGYIGSGIATVGHLQFEEGCQLINFSTEEPIILLPPNLKINVQRDCKINYGLYKSINKKYRIGSEGSALTSDSRIIMSTQWYDHDGSLLPEKLPGYTARFAQSTASNSLSKINQFKIMPGLHTQLLKLKPFLFKAHYYVHVNGEPDDRNPNFSGNGRPDNYVPIKVPIYDKQATLELAEKTALAEKKKTDERDVPPIYKWVYRPEMQFSIYELDMQVIHVIKGDESYNALEQKIPNIDSTADKIHLLYSLLESKNSMIAPKVDKPRELVFSIADEKKTVSIGQNRIVSFYNIQDGLLPDEFLTLRLYQNDDDPNVLWECASCNMTIRMKNNKYPIFNGDTGTAIVLPPNQNVVWSLESKEEGVKATINPNSGLIKASDNGKMGWITIKAVNQADPKCYARAKLFIGCDSCSSTECAVGKLFISLSSINIIFNLGRSMEGKSIGELFLKADKPTSDLATPKMLSFSTLADDIKIYHNQDGTIKYIDLNDNYLFISVIDNFSYQMSLYRKKDVTFDEHGVPKPFETSRFSKKWLVENPDASNTIFNRLYITEYNQDSSIAYVYNRDEKNNEWTLSKGNGLSIERLKETVEKDKRIVEQEIKDASGNIASKIIKVFKQNPWGDDLIEEIIDPEGKALKTVYTYYEDPLEKSFRKIKTISNPDGSWKKYEYDTHGRKKREILPWLDSDIDSPDTNLHIINYSYNVIDPEDKNLPENFMDPRTIEETINNTIVSKTYYAYIINGASQYKTVITEKCLNGSASYGHPNNLRSIHKFSESKRDDVSYGKILQITYSDNRFDMYQYERGTFSPNTIKADARFEAGAGTDVREIVTHGTKENPNGIPGKMTRDVTIYNKQGQVLMYEIYIYNGSGFERIQWQVNELDEMGRLIKVNKSNGEIKELSWGCCQKESETTANGVTKSFFYDDLGRLSRIIKQGINHSNWPAQFDIQTDYTYNALGKILTEKISSNGLSQTKTNTFDQAGRLIQKIDEAGLVTTFEYTNGGLIQTIIKPGGSKEINIYYIDGQLKSTTGSSVISTYYKYDINADGTKVITIYYGNENSSMWQRVTTDMLNREIKIEEIAFDGSIICKNNYFNSKDQLIKTQITGMADTLYTYDEYGDIVLTGLDMNHNGILDVASNDHIQESNKYFSKSNNVWFLETIHKIYAKENDSTSTIIAAQKKRLSDFNADGLISEIINIDELGNKTIYKSFIDRENKIERNVIANDHSTINQETILINGLLVSKTSNEGIEVKYVYDSLGRKTGEINPRTGTILIHYNQKGQIDYYQNPKNYKVSFAYDLYTGKKIAETNALGKTIRYAYNDRGQVTHKWGDSINSTKYEYDLQDYGQVSRMYTYRNGTNWNSVSWPASTGEADVTIWRYDDKTGFLTEKEDHEGNKTTFTYTNLGKLYKRIWARKDNDNDNDNDNELITTYSYDPNTHDLIKIDYSDENTDDISFTYNRFGKQSSITDANGLRVFKYNDKLQLMSESMNGLNNATIHRYYDAYGRSTGLSNGDDYSVTYSYETETGRFKSINWHVADIERISTYSYLENSHLLSQLVTTSGTIKNHISTYSYESERNLLTTVENKYGTTLISRYDCSYNPIELVKAVKNSGQAFADPEESFYKYHYNDHNELIESNRYSGSDVIDTSNPILKEYRNYEYDNIGNRKNSTNFNNVITYKTNALNQYEQTTSAESSDQYFEYDNDGNMIKSNFDQSSTIYNYNAENRLIEVVSENPINGDKKLVFLYDYMGRRIEKSVYIRNNQQWDLYIKKQFIYDNWNIIQEKTFHNDVQTTKYYVWGLDQSQSLHTNGGVGGLIGSVDMESKLVSYYHYDANGNVGQLINSDNGEILVRYEYDPFGNQTLAKGPYLNNNPFCYSTKYYDAETGLIYYGYRYYYPKLGRWGRRDPMDIKGGILLYGFVFNNSINLIDPFGLKWSTILCKEKSKEFSGSLALGLGAATSVKAMVKKCDCCNGETNEYIKGEWFNPSKGYMEMSLVASFSLKIAVSSKLFGIGFDLEFAKISFSQTANATKTCDMSDLTFKFTIYSVTGTLGANFTESISFFAFNAKSVINYGVWVDIIYKHSCFNYVVQYEWGYAKEFEISLKKFKKTKVIDSDKNRIKTYDIPLGCF